MNATIDTIKQEIKNLRPVERFDLWHDLGKEFAPSFADQDDYEEAVEAAWDAEIDDRVKEIEEGKVQLISAEESDRRTTVLLAELRSKRNGTK